jgi:PAS domain S-box-containing protein
MTITRVSDGVYVDVNDAFVRIVGFNREEVIGRSSLDLGIWVHPDNRKELLDLLQRTVTIENMEAQFRKKDGTIFSGLTSWQVITFENEPHLLGVVKDITERKLMEEQVSRSLEEKAMLLKEIHHRVKNNLQAVAGLLNLQAELISDEDTLASFKENETRILSMALIHEKLYQVEDPSRINMKDYVKTLVDRLVHFHSISPDQVKVSVRSAKVSLNLDTIVPVGLILNELVSNALKYAFPDGRKGEIRVSLSRQKDESLSLKVSDNGIGLPDEVDIGRSKSLGMMLVKSFVDGLSGTVKVDRSSGTGITITFREYLEGGIDYTS